MAKKVTKKKPRQPKVKLPFPLGTVVVWDSNRFNREHWSTVSEKDRKRWYGVLGYGKKKPPLWVYMGEILDSSGYSSGHCVLVSLEDQHVETMRHTCEFRKATDEEF